MWPSAGFSRMWYPDLLSVLMDELRELTIGGISLCSLIYEGMTSQASLNLHMCRLATESFKGEAFLKRLHSRIQPLFKGPLSSSVRAVRQFSVTDIADRRLPISLPRYTECDIIVHSVWLILVF